MADDPAPLLRSPGQEAGHVDEGDKRDVEGVAEADEAPGFHGRVAVEGAGEGARIVRHDSDRMAAESRETADDALGRELVHLEELAVVDDAVDDPAHVVGLRGLVWDDAVELGVLAPDWVRWLEVRRRVDVVLGQERDEVAGVLEARLLAR